jgi:DNA polymerase III epsilon subunit-like protein
MIALDCEMSGLDPKAHSILSIGAVDMDNLERSFYGECYLPEGKTFQKEALAINGFTEENIKPPLTPPLKGGEKSSLKELMQNLLEWVRECKEITLLGQNVSLDKEFLNQAFMESGMDFRFHYRVIDIHSVAVSQFMQNNIDIPKKENNRISLSLDTIAKKLGMPEEPRPHNALTGASYNAEIFQKLMSKSFLQK